MSKSIGPFSFCPKHNVFYKSCGCSWEKKKKKESDVIEVEDDKKEDA